MTKTVRNMNTLRAMERAGLITLHNQTGSQIEGLYSNKRFTCYYIDDGRPCFDWNGKQYATQYSPGSFYPYVVQIA